MDSKFKYAVVVLALGVASLSAASAHAQDPRPPDPHIRSHDPELVNATVDGARASETLRDLIAHIEASDFVAYLAPGSPASRAQ